MRILHIVGTMNLGGQETFIMNVYRKIDRSKYQFDFIVSDKKKGYYDDEIKSLGGAIYYAPPIKKNIIKRFVVIRKIIKDNKYEVIHRHSAFSIAFVDLLIGMLSKVKVRIIHSHADYDSHKLHKLMMPLVVAFSNCRLACSDKAGKWMFGEKSDYEVLFNGIDTTRFQYNAKKRDIVRAEYGIDSGAKVIGNIGRLTNEKNQMFLLDVFSRIHEKEKNTYLVIVGEGELKEKLWSRCKELNILSNVIFCGQKGNVEDYLSSFDIYMFPSKHEGLGIALIEAEANGLVCLVSDKINDEAVISPKTKKIPLLVNEWVEEYFSIKDDNLNHELKNVELNKYDISRTVSKLGMIYDKASI